MTVLKQKLNEFYQLGLQATRQCGDTILKEHY